MLHVEQNLLLKTVHKKVKIHSHGYRNSKETRTSQIWSDK